jgi:hypothetical protein
MVVGGGLSEWSCVCEVINILANRVEYLLLGRWKMKTATSLLQTYEIACKYASYGKLGKRRSYCKRQKGLLFLLWKDRCMKNQDRNNLRIVRTWKKCGEWRASSLRKKMVLRTRLRMVKSEVLKKSELLIEFVREWVHDMDLLWCKILQSELKFKVQKTYLALLMRFLWKEIHTGMFKCHAGLAALLIWSVLLFRFKSGGSTTHEERGLHVHLGWNLKVVKRYLSCFIFWVHQMHMAL